MVKSSASKPSGGGTSPVAIPRIVYCSTGRPARGPSPGTKVWAASSCFSSSRVLATTQPVPSVVRSTVESWIATTWPSRVMCRSISNALAPRAAAVSYA